MYYEWVIQIVSDNVWHSLWKEIIVSVNTDLNSEQKHIDGGTEQWWIYFL